ncbi:60S ribosomal protein L8 [Anopheles sinensis]|uniref:60S ribosomal protein L8 n=1 Tax=Anopheles sinensis TaxID=74873 RepID=A0A084WB64_ANOSI|nr:60S ribosomal protein L8 [Anopheles sinensis]
MPPHVASHRRPGPPPSDTVVFLRILAGRRPASDGPVWRSSVDRDTGANRFRSTTTAPGALPGEMDFIVHSPAAGTSNRAPRTLPLLLIFLPLFRAHGALVGRWVQSGKKPGTLLLLLLLLMANGLVIYLPQFPTLLIICPNHNNNNNVPVGS